MRPQFAFLMIVVSCFGSAAHAQWDPASFGWVGPAPEADLPAPTGNHDAAGYLPHHGMSDCGECCVCNEVCWTVRTGAVLFGRNQAQAKAAVRGVVRALVCPPPVPGPVPVPCPCPVGCACGGGCGCGHGCGCAAACDCEIPSPLPPGCVIVEAPFKIPFAAQIGQGVGAGAFVSLLGHKKCGAGYEVTYFNVNGFQADEKFSVGATCDTCNEVISCGHINVKADSEFQSFELNLIRPLNCWTCLIGGVRWLRLEESASIHAVAGGSTFCTLTAFDRSAATTNDLVGCQLGVKHSIWDAGGNLTVDGLVKSGLYANFIDQSGPGGGGDATDVSFGGEADLSAAYQWSERWSLIGGYKLLWIQDVALALEQLSATPGAIDDTGDLVLNGGYIGAQFVW